MKKLNVCKICGNSKYKVKYEGPIRLGKFGDISKKRYKINECLSCGVISLPNVIEDSTAYYETDAYRKDVDEGSDVSDYFRIHDKEQVRNLQITGTSIFRDRIVADIGCGAGSFLDSIKGYVRRAIAIEPSMLFRRSLEKRGYITYPYITDALSVYENKVDIAVSFSVLEHIDNPLLFLKQIRNILSSTGKLIISTPNADDILLQVLPDVYPQFFYRKAHLWYFNSISLKKVLELAGYKEIKIIPYHRFGLSNFLIWLRDKTPKGDLKIDFITDAMDVIWKLELERTMRCDYLYAEVSKKSVGVPYEQKI